MDLTDVLEIAREALWVTIKVSGPLMIVSLVIGLGVSLFQALTQIQEMTLAFVPKIIAVFAFMIVLLPFMTAVLKDFTVGLFARIAGGG
jgi:flagellar biosynthetic protein FliQ